MPRLTFAIPRKLYFIPPVSVAEVVGQQTFALARLTDGTNWAWGRNTSGEIGNNTVTNYCSPVSVAGASKTFCDIAAGDNHSLGVDKYGQVWSWGQGTYGQLGNNSTASRRTPVSILGAKKTFCSVSGGVYHSAGIDQYGKAWTWGRNLWGELGDKTVVGKCTPVSVQGTFTFCKISAGNSATFGIDQNGRGWAWGYVGNGQTGTGALAGLCRCSPVTIAGALKTFCYITAGLNYGMAIDLRGKGWGWGVNSLGRIGNNSSTNVNTPVSVYGNKTFCQIVLANNTTVALDKDGKLWSWGANTIGEMGLSNSDLAQKSTPVAVAGSTKTFCTIGRNNYVSHAVDNYGKLWGWGYQFWGELGANYPINWSPRSINKPVTFCKFSLGSFNSGGIDSNGLLFNWGRGRYGQIGNNLTSDQITPVSVAGVLKTFCKISLGNEFGLSIDKNGRAWSWGYNLNGNLGDNSTTSRITPVSILGSVKTFCEISAGLNHSMGITNSGGVWGWGFNLYGNLGDNSTTSRRTPVSVAGATKTFCKINSGEYHNASIDKYGRVWTWGYNNFGQLGDNSITSRRTPVSILGSVKTFCEISCGRYHTMAIDKNGRAWGWGFNGNRLGDGTSTSRRTPVSVTGTIKTFCKISAGFDYTMAIDKYGKLWVWGNNGYGQMGTGDYTGRNTPVSVFNTANKTFCELFSGYNGAEFAGAVDKNGVIWQWGKELYGELGLGNPSTATPVCIPYL